MILTAIEIYYIGIIYVIFYYATIYQPNYFSLSSLADFPNLFYTIELTPKYYLLIWKFLFIYILLGWAFYLTIYSVSEIYQGYNYAENLHLLSKLYNSDFIIYTCTKLNSVMYIYRIAIHSYKIEANGLMQTRKMILVKS